MYQTQEIVTHYVTELNKRNYSVLDDVLNMEVTVEGIKITKDEYKQQIEDRIKIYPDYFVKIIDMKTDGDTVILHWHLSGNNKETGEELKEELISNYKFDNGKISEVY